MAAHGSGSGTDWDDEWGCGSLWLFCDFIFLEFCDMCSLLMEVKRREEPLVSRVGREGNESVPKWVGWKQIAVSLDGEKFYGVSLVLLTMVTQSGWVVTMCIWRCMGDTVVVHGVRGIVCGVTWGHRYGGCVWATLEEYEREDFSFFVFFWCLIHGRGWVKSVMEEHVVHG